MIRQITAMACVSAMVFALSAAAVPAQASDDTLGKFLSNCADALIEPMCLMEISDEVDIVAQMGDACIPDSIDSNQASSMVLQRLRSEAASQPDIASHDSDAEQDKAISALWPC